MANEQKIGQVTTFTDVHGECTILRIGRTEALTGMEIASIEEVVEDLGTYGVKWFVAKNDAGNVLAKLNALYVEKVVYTAPGFGESSHGGE